MSEKWTNYPKQGEDLLDHEVASGTRTVSWVDENGAVQVTYQPVPKFNPIKEKYFYRYLSPGFMKQYKSLIRLYNTMAQELMRQ